jgi:hypothetical protein
MASGSRPSYNAEVVTLNAHFDGKTIVLDEPVSLPFQTGARLKLKIELINEQPAVGPAPRHFQPLNIQIDPDLSNAIAVDPQLTVED